MKTTGKTGVTASRVKIKLELNKIQLNLARVGHDSSQKNLKSILSRSAVTPVFPTT